MHLDAVAERDELGVILVIFNLLHLTGLWHLGNEWLILHLFLQRLDVFRFHLRHPLEEVFLSGQNVIFLVGSEHCHNKIVIRFLLHKAVDHIHGSGRNELVHGVVLPFDARHGFVVKEVAYTLVHIIATLHLVAVQVGTLER